MKTKLVVFRTIHSVTWVVEFLLRFVIVPVAIVGFAAFGFWELQRLDKHIPNSWTNLLICICMPVAAIAFTLCCTLAAAWYIYWLDRPGGFTSRCTNRLLAWCRKRGIHPPRFFMSPRFCTCPANRMATIGGNGLFTNRYSETFYRCQCCGSYWCVADDQSEEQCIHYRNVYGRTRIRNCIRELHRQGLLVRPSIHS